MYYLFKTINVGKGDCIMFFLKNEEHEIHIMVDCGRFNHEVKEFIEDKFRDVIDYLIVTHIDDDHLIGVNEMLTAKPKLQIRHILYNCYQRTSDNLKEWDNNMKANVKRMFAEMPAVIDMIDYKINEKTAKTLAETIMTNKEWKNVWQREYITENSPSINLGENFGKIVFLSPTQDALDKLDKKYRKLFWQVLYKGKDVDYKEEETIYESLMRIMQERSWNELETSIANIVLDESSLLKYSAMSVINMTDSNIASIAFVWEHQNHRILFLGDAEPSQICNSIEKLYADETKPVRFDLIKVSHHGSAHSTTLDLMNYVDSERFFLTGGTAKAPSLEALSRILLAPLTNGITQREIRYNRENVNILSLASIDDEIKQKYNFTINDNNEYELSY